MPGFVGRTDELKRLKQKMLGPGPHQITSILGLGGIGKSRLVLELVYQINMKDPQYSIFWIEAAQQLTFKRDVFDIEKKLKIAGVKILILDNANDESLWKKLPDSTRQ